MSTTIFPRDLRAAEIAAADLAAHEADTDNPHEVVKADVGLSNVANLFHKLDATTAPGVGDDTADGYAVGSVWVNVSTDRAYVCVDSTGGAAVWVEVTSATDENAIHTNIGSEISALTQKTAPTGADHLVIEDAAASNAKKRILISALPLRLPGPSLFSWPGDATGAHRSTTSSVTIGNIAWQPATYDAVWTHVRFVMLLSATAAGAEPVNIDLMRTQLFGGSEGSDVEVAVSSTSSIAGGTSAWSVVTALVARSSLSASNRHYWIRMSRGGSTGSALGLSFAAFLTTADG